MGRARSARAKRDNDKEGIRSTKYNSSSNNNMPDGAALHSGFKRLKLAKNKFTQIGFS